MAIDTLGHLIALTVTPASEQERAQVDALCQQVHQATSQTVKLAWADQGCTGEQAKNDAAEHGIDLQVVKLPALTKVQYTAENILMRKSFSRVFKFQN